MALLDSLTPEEAQRYKAFLTTSFSPQDLDRLLSEILPPQTHMDPTARDRLLLALATATKVFAVDVIESAMGVREGEEGGGGGGGAPLSPGHVSEAWRRMMLEGKVLGMGKSLESAKQVREEAARSLAQQQQQHQQQHQQQQQQQQHK